MNPYRRCDHEDRETFTSQVSDATYWECRSCGHRSEIVPPVRSARLLWVLGGLAVLLVLAGWVLR